MRVGRSPRNTGQAFQAGVLEGTLEEEIASRFTGQGQIGKKEDIGPGMACLADQVQDLFFIGGDVTQPDFR